MDREDIERRAREVAESFAFRVPTDVLGKTTAIGTVIAVDGDELKIDLETPSVAAERFLREAD